MKMKGTLIAASVAGLFATLAPGAAMASDKSDEQIICEGINSCKGHGSCAGAGHSCAGQNGCKGQGHTKTSAKDCTAKGGKIAKK
jgi:hypothetical protein